MIYAMKGSWIDLEIMRLIVNKALECISDIKEFNRRYTIFYNFLVQKEVAAPESTDGLVPADFGKGPINLLIFA